MKSVISKIIESITGVNNKSMILTTIGAAIFSPTVSANTDFKLIDAANNKAVFSISNNQVISLSSIPSQYSLSYEPNTIPSVDTVLVSLNGPISAKRTEKVYPYTLYGDINGDYYANSKSQSLIPGDYKLTANGQSVNFTVVTKITLEPKPKHPSPSVTSQFKLIDAQANSETMTLYDQAVLKLSDVPSSYSISYEPDMIPSGKVIVSLTGQVFAKRTESVYPYTLFGDIDATGNYFGNPSDKKLVPGEYEISANGESIRFSISDGGTSPPPPPPTELVGLISCSESSSESAYKQWHKVTISCKGDQTWEENDGKTFTDHRMNLTFTHVNSGKTFLISGHFAADGNAANSSANKGSIWRGFFSPMQAGLWEYQVEFRKGSNIAVSDAMNAGQLLSRLGGSFKVESVFKPSNLMKNRDLRLRGLLKHNEGDRYLRFEGSGDVFIEGGMGSPENIFGYHEFDNTTKYSNVDSCKGILHRFDAHEKDWTNADPTWKNGKGKGLVGLVNYIASKNVNSAYVMANTKNGDGCDAHPWSNYNTDFKNYDVSKLDQWEIVFGHMMKKGLMIHLMTQETENDQMINNGNLGVERKLYYRELISRFGHHPAIQWNLGEENTNTSDQVKSFANYIRKLDAYEHPIVMHTYPNQHDRYNPLLGINNFDGPTIQVGGIGDIYSLTRNWITKSASSGNPWYVTITEASGGDAPVPYQNVSYKQRVDYMYGNMMAGGGGVAWYLKTGGAGHAYDLAVEDLREFDQLWNQTGYAVNFFRDYIIPKIDLAKLEPANHLTDTTNDWVLAKPGKAYLVFLKSGQKTNITLADGNYKTLWFDPISGYVSQGIDMSGPGTTHLGSSPTGSNQSMVLIYSTEDSIYLPPTETINGDYTEKNGLVVMEAENTSSNLGLWDQNKVLSGYTGTGYLEFLGNTHISGPATSPLRYTFTTDKGGIYYLHLRMAKQTVDGRTDVANDVYVRLEGNVAACPGSGNSHGDNAPLNLLINDTKYYGGSNNAFSWATGNHLDPGGHNNKRVACYQLQSGQTYDFVMSGRSKFAKIDRIIFRHNTVGKSSAQSLSNDETKSP